MDTNIENTDNPNVFGEFIRNAVFVKNRGTDFGCYSTFELTSDFKPISPESSPGKRLVQMLLSDDDFFDCIDQEELALCRLFSNGIFTVAWYWEGDGTLLVGSGSKFAINFDCKKEYGWVWCEPLEFTLDDEDILEERPQDDSKDDICISMKVNAGPISFIEYTDNQFILIGNDDIEIKLTEEEAITICKDSFKFTQEALIKIINMVYPNKNF
jgi:hypothetical protein